MPGLKIGEAPLPFDETIVTMLDKAHDVTVLSALEELIILTKIPKNHDNIGKAYIGAIARIGPNLSELENELQPTEVVTKLVLEAKKALDDDKKKGEKTKTGQKRGKSQITGTSGPT